MANGLRHVYTGNVDDPTGQTTYCSGCGAAVIERDWYRLGDWRLDGAGCCACGTRCAGVFDPDGPGTWGPRRLPVRLAG
jgi:pyruvate formate lyase activating enzyme